MHVRRITRKWKWSSGADDMAMSPTSRQTWCCHGFPNVKDMTSIFKILCNFIFHKWWRRRSGCTYSIDSWWCTGIRTSSTIHVPYSTISAVGRAIISWVIQFRHIFLVRMQISVCMTFMAWCNSCVFLQLYVQICALQMSTAVVTLWHWIKAFPAADVPLPLLPGTIPCQFDGGRP